MPVLAPLRSDRSSDLPRPARPPARDREEQGFLVQLGVLVAAIMVVLDQATKELAVNLLVPLRRVDVIAEGWGWQLTFNDGGAFGFPAPSWFFLAVTVIVAFIVVRNLPHAHGLPQAIAYGLLMAGALGNALDRVFRTGDVGDPRFFHGHVVDFIAWGSFPRFNIADVAITLGFGLLILALWREDQTEDRRERTAASTAEPTRDLGERRTVGGQA